MDYDNSRCRQGIPLMTMLVHRFETRLIAIASAVASRWRCNWARHRGHYVGKSVKIGSRVKLSALPGRIKIGDKSTIHTGVCLIAANGWIEIGRNCSINPGCMIYGHGGLKIGDNVRIAANSVIVPANHRFDDMDRQIFQQGESVLGVEIGSDVWIGTSVVILDGVKIGRGCVIGAGAIVTRSTEPDGVYVGSPARLMRKRGE